MRVIPLTQGKCGIVDDEDFGWVSQWKWYVQKNRNTFYAMRKTNKDGKRATILMHREIVKPPKNMKTDHRDYDGLNNQRCNLRLATSLQNVHNRRKQTGLLRPGTSKYKGVCRDFYKHKWLTRITVEGRRFHLGRFDNEEDAARIYDAAAQKFFGEFAKINIA